jgi:hypothetical protein
MDPIFDNLAGLMVILFVYSVAKATRDLQYEYWDVSSDYDLHSPYSSVELHIIGMQVHQE